MKSDHSLTPYTKWIKDLNVRSDTIKLLEENIGGTLCDINHSNIFFDPSPRIIEIKTKISKWNLLKFKSFCIVKETRIYNGEKIVSSINGAGKTGQLHVKK